MSLKRRLYEGYKTVYNSLHDVSTVSDFQRTGMLTPKEFICAGDELTQKMPAWRWVDGPKDVLDFLPINKKCLVYRGAPCLQRAPSDTATAPDDVHEQGEFVVIEHSDNNLRHVETTDEVAVSWSGGDVSSDSESSDDDRAARVKGSELMRMYDVYICYDQYYRTPRVYLIGYRHDHITPLSIEEMKQDVYHANYGKTVTIDPHPILHIPCISVHPCRHAETLRHLMRRMADKAKNCEQSCNASVEYVFPVHNALLLFLKFISTVVPTIEYDVSAGYEL